MSGSVNVHDANDASNLMDVDEERGEGQEDREEEAESRRTLSMYFGVVAPVTLSMFSTLLYLRIGYIVGNAGLVTALAFLFVAYAILGITISSIAAISTNGEVKGGGVYFMISRTLGKTKRSYLKKKIVMIFDFFSSSRT